MEDLVSKTSEALNARGIRGSLAVYRGGLYWRGVYTDANGKRSQRRVKLDVGPPIQASWLLPRAE